MKIEQSAEGADMAIHGRKGQTRSEVIAEVGMYPEFKAAVTIKHLEGGEKELLPFVKSLQEQVANVAGGDMSRPGSFLVNQAHVLDELFNSMVRRSHSNMESGYGEAAERYMRLALRAQNQCRTTIEALSAIKNPPVIYAKQANISNGPQQVNNGVPMPCNSASGEASHTHMKTINQNELSGESHELLPDARASGKTIRINPTLEAVGEINRTQNRAREAG